jgi:hypothetical protein
MNNFGFGSTVETRLNVLIHLGLRLAFGGGANTGESVVGATDHWRIDLRSGYSALFITIIGGVTVSFGLIIRLLAVIGS